jgi:putative ABC transport system substrate-binding protein
MHLAAIVFIVLASLPPGAAAESRIARIAVLGIEPTSSAMLRQALVDALRDRGWEEGRNLEILWRWTEGRAERFPQLAAELVALQPDVIYAQTTQGTQAVREKTDVIPIVMSNVADPIASGFVGSLARPGGNITGLSSMGDRDSWGKWLQLLVEVRPGISPASTSRKDALAATAVQLGITLEWFAIHAPEDLPTVLAVIARWHPDALLIDFSPLVGAHGRELIAFALEPRLPTFTPFVQMARDGALMSYGPDLIETPHRVADYVDRILRGAKPADLPVEQPTKFKFVLNLKTAHAIGLQFPPLFFARADEVIE